MMNESNPNVIINDGTNAVAVKAGTSATTGAVPGALDAAVVVTTSPNSPELLLFASIALLLKGLLVEMRVQTGLIALDLVGARVQNMEQLRIDEELEISKLINS